MNGFKALRERATEPELMDDEEEQGQELREAYAHLRRINRIFGAAGPIQYGVKRVWETAGKPTQLSIVDVGAGSGDVNRRLLRWADKQGVQLTITLVDIREEACEEAARFYAGEERIRVVRCDAFSLPSGSADLITVSQFLHHFPSRELPGIVRRFMDASRLGIIIHDIHRHRIAWLAVWLMTRLLSRNRYLREDGPLSVAKGFRKPDWEAIRKACGWSSAAYSWRPLFRYVFWAMKTPGEADV
ncbi:methyltransferase domain-containing protein [Paenibacillus koleovorans]|uniref:methyltransferase domain-containing protein n=1 Tax=Paenibacillus koleovorans TaxID=121608 RepID=UPI000FDA284D|nr:methyltransferase domain-containing protein [Paenibacillus koleovorans]